VFLVAARPEKPLTTHFIIDAVFVCS